jgi:phosphoserine phosphatase RsbU/P
MEWSYPELRRRLKAADLWPEGRMARLACYLAAMAAVLFALKKLLGLFAASLGEHLGGWVEYLGFIAAALFSILAFKWARRRILWRLRNRLIVTYVFIGVIPAVLLVAMAFITLYGLAGQFAVFVVTSEVHAQLRSLEAANAAVSNELAARLERGDSPASESLAGLRKRDPAWARRQVCAWYGEKPLPLCNEFKGAAITLPRFGKSKLRDIVRDHSELHLRVMTTLSLGTNKLVVVTSEPFDKELVGNIAADIGEITLFAEKVDQASSGGGTTPGQPASPAASGPVAQNTPDNKSELTASSRQQGTRVVHDNRNMLPAFTVGVLSPASGRLDQEVLFATPLQVMDWNTGQQESVAAAVRTRPSILYAHLFAALGEFVGLVVYTLVAVGIFFAVIELIALIIGTRMTRTVTAAVAQLHEATKHIDRGDFSHRIPVKSQDQLAELAVSFNSMTASIEKLILEQKEKQRLENELAIAQEVQAQLFPRQVSELESLEVHGFCRPARTVSGDYYDFLTASSHKMILAVGDISGKGISAALLMATIHSAVRAYSIESLPQLREVTREPMAVGAVSGGGRMMATFPDGLEVSPGALLALLNHQLYESTPPEKYATLFLGIYDGLTQRLTYSNGGHLPPILISEDGSIRRLEDGGTVVGLFDNMTYAEGAVDLHPGEIFVAYSDGVTEPENDFGEFGEQRLIDLVRDNRHLPLAQISQIVTAAVDMWIGDKEQPDDVTLVLARAR